MKTYMYSRRSTDIELYLGEGITKTVELTEDECLDDYGEPKKWVHLVNKGNQSNKIQCFKLVERR